MASIPFQPPRRSFTFSHSVSGFLNAPGLPFSGVLTKQRILGIFAKGGGLFGRTYTTAIVLWAFLSQKLRDGKETGETALLRELLSCFARGDIAVVDRFYGNYWVIALLMNAGVDICFRKHQNRKTDFPRGKRLGRSDHLVSWNRPPRPSWMSRELYESLPESIKLREIRYMISEPGRRHEPFVVVTSLYDEEGPQQYTFEDIAELFSYRWNAELDIRSIKTHLNLHHLRCKSPEMVRKEFWTRMIAYNAIRMTAANAAELCEVPPREISFVSTCQYVLSGWDKLTDGTIARDSLTSYCHSRLKKIAQCRVAQRPGRFEPRVRKKRGSNYNLMMQPRAELHARLEKGDNSFET